ncbi:MAG: YfhO family protein [Caldilineaceae bacterium]|nr:YfhO family protein [Caldilineaceae bacterium]
MLIGIVCLVSLPVVSGQQMLGTGDLDTFAYPLFHALGRAIRQLNFSDVIWNPNIFAGFPLLAEGQIGAFFPVHWLTLLLFNSTTALNASLMLSYVIAALSTCWFARLLGLRWAGALVAAVAFTFSGFLVGHVGHVSVFTAGCWLPVILCAVELAAQRRLAFGYAAGVAWGIQWLAGHPQVPFMTLIWVASYIGFRFVMVDRSRTLRQRLARAAAVLGTVLIVGVGIAAVYLLPLAELSGVSMRLGGRMDYAEASSYSLFSSNLIVAVLPFFFGIRPYWGAWNYAEISLYVGLLTLLLAAAALATKSFKPLVIFLLGMAALSLILALGGNTPLYRFLQALPGLSSFRAPIRFVYLLDFSLALLAGVGMHVILEQVDGRLTKRLALIAAVAGALLALALAGLNASLTGPNAQPLSDSWATWLGGGQVSTAYMQAGLIQATDLRDPYTLLPALGLIVIAGWLWLMPRIPRQIWWSIGLLLLVADLAVFVTRYQAVYLVPVNRETQSELWQSVKDLNLEQQRVYIVNGKAPWQQRSYLSLIQDVPDLDGYSPLETHWHDIYMQNFWSGQPPTMRLLSLASVRYLIDLRNRLNCGSANQASWLADAPAQQWISWLPFTAMFAADAVRPESGFYHVEGCRPIKRGQNWTIYENDEALPRAYVAHTVLKAKPDAPWPTLFEPDFIPGETVVIPDAAAPEPAGHGSSTVTIESDHALRVALQISTESDGYLVLNDSYYPGWQATVDGAPAQIYRGNFLFRAVYVPAGEHTVVFEYVPVYLQLGAIITVTTALFVLTATLYSLKRSRRKAASV